MKGETFTCEVTGETRDACQASALAKARAYFGGSKDLEVVALDVHQVPNPDLRLAAASSMIFGATVKIEEKQGNQVWFMR